MAPPGAADPAGPQVGLPAALQPAGGLPHLPAHHPPAQHLPPGGQSLHLLLRPEGRHQLRAVLHPPGQLPRDGPDPAPHHVSHQHAALPGGQEEWEHPAEAKSAEKPTG